MCMDFLCSSICLIGVLLMKASRGLEDLFCAYSGPHLGMSGQKSIICICQRITMTMDDPHSGLTSVGVGIFDIVHEGA